MKKLSLLFICFIILSAIGLSSAEKAPGFALINNKGKYVFKSKMTENLIVSFWASYCKPCKKEMPEIIHLMDKYGKKKNLKLVLINVDDNRGGQTAKKKADIFLKNINVKKDYLLDSYQRTITKYNPKIKVPATFLIDKNGYFRLKAIGFDKNTLKKLETAIKKLR